METRRRIPKGWIAEGRAKERINVAKKMRCNSKGRDARDLQQSDCRGISAQRERESGLNHLSRQLQAPVAASRPLPALGAKQQKTWCSIVKFSRSRT
jgi:hypothetical protein